MIRNRCGAQGMKNNFIVLRNFIAEHCAWRKIVARLSGATQQLLTPPNMRWAIKKKKTFPAQAKVQGLMLFVSAKMNIFVLSSNAISDIQKHLQFSINWINFARFSFQEISIKFCWFCKSYEATWKSCFFVTRAILWTQMHRATSTQSEINFVYNYAVN